MNVIIVFGLPGSGKSYFAKRLAEVLDATYLSTDELRNRFNTIHDYSFSGKMKIYEKMVDLTEQALNTNDSVVLDGTFYRHTIREKIQLHFEEMGAHVLFLEIKADLFLIKERLKSKRDFSDADYDVYQKLSKSFERMCVPHFVICSTNDNIDDMVRLGRKYVESSKNFVQT